MSEYEPGILQRISQTEYEEAQLTPRLAAENPTLFKAKMINSLGLDHGDGVVGERSKAAWFRLAKRDECNLNSITLDTDTWVSSTHPPRMTIGLGPLPEGTREKVLFDDESFTPQTELLYRFSHEVSHPTAAALAGQSARFNSLYTTAVSMRSSGQSKGFSGLGSLDFYKSRGPEVQGKEDVTELLNMYLWSPDYVRRFLRFLSDPDFKTERDRVGLLTLKKGVAGEMYRIVQQAADNLLSTR